jgi:SAM-dependent methyltransferase
LRLTVRAVDISQEILEFAERGVYSRSSDVTGDTFKDQERSIFERVTDEEMEAMFEVEDDLVKVKPWLKEGIIWLCGDAGDPALTGLLGYQDIVVANRFLFHMKPMAAERCLRNIARLVKPGGYLFVSGIDLDVRTKVARAMGWKPVTDLMREIHEGDPSLRRWWPLEYHGLEPFRDNCPDWKIHYASVFQIGETP